LSAKSALIFVNRLQTGSLIDDGWDLMILIFVLMRSPRNCIVWLPRRIFGHGGSRRRARARGGWLRSIIRTCFQFAKRLLDEFGRAAIQPPLQAATPFVGIRINPYEEVKSRLSSRATHGRFS
jgi:hypothetical protein